MEEGLEEEVERRGEENTQEQVRMPMTMDGNEDTQTRLEPHVTVYASVQCISKRCAAGSELRSVHVSVHCDVHAIGHSALRIVEVVREDIRIVPYSLCIIKSSGISRAGCIPFTPLPSVTVDCRQL